MGTGGQTQKSGRIHIISAALDSQGGVTDLVISWGDEGVIDLVIVEDEGEGGVIGEHSGEECPGVGKCKARARVCVCVCGWVGGWVRVCDGCVMIVVATPSECLPNGRTSRCLGIARRGEGWGLGSM